MSRPRSRDRVRILRALDAAPDGLTLRELDALATDGRPALMSHLANLIDWGEIRADDDRYFSTRKQMVFNRKPTAPISATLGTVRDALVQSFEHDVNALAIEAVESDPVLFARLDAAIVQGLELDLADTPRYRRPGAVEDALDEWDRGRFGGPCQVCGTATARPGYAPRSAFDGQITPSFHKGRCDFCSEAIQALGEGMFRARVYGALLGVKRLDGKGAPLLFFGELREHVDVRPGRPWAFLPADLLTGLDREMNLAGHCYVTNERDSLIHSFDGITAPIHDPATLRPTYVPPMDQRPIYRPHSEAAEEAFQKHRERVIAANAEIKERWARMGDVVEPLDKQRPNMAPVENMPLAPFSTRSPVIDTPPRPQVRRSKPTPTKTPTADLARALTAVLASR